jgi:hypothetical protein
MLLMVWCFITLLYHTSFIFSLFSFLTIVTSGEEHTLYSLHNPTLMSSTFCSLLMTHPSLPPYENLVDILWLKGALMIRVGYIHHTEASKGNCYNEPLGHILFCGKFRMSRRELRHTKKLGCISVVIRSAFESLQDNLYRAAQNADNVKHSLLLKGETCLNWYSGGGGRWSPIGSIRHCGHL